MDRLVAEGIIEQVQFTDLAVDIAPVLKPDKASVRIHDDFKLTINQASKLDRYPIPSLLAKLASGKRFTHLDFSQAYQQLLVDDKSKDYVHSSRVI